jgi:hypothetical protein
MAQLRQRLQQLAPCWISGIARHSGAQPQTHAPFASLPAALLETRRGFRGSGKRSRAMRDVPLSQQMSADVAASVPTAGSMLVQARCWISTPCWA